MNNNSLFYRLVILKMVVPRTKVCAAHRPGIWGKTRVWVRTRIFDFLYPSSESFFWRGYVAAISC